MRMLPLLVALPLLLSCGASTRGEAVGKVAPDDLPKLLAAPDGPALVDVRTREEWTAGHIPGALWIPLQELPQRSAELSRWKERGLVLYCQSGRRASKAADLLRKQGFQHLSLLDGSIQRWKAEGRAVEVPQATR